MAESSPSAPRVSALQRAWLQELGIESPLLSRWLAPDAGAVAPGRPARDADAASPGRARESRHDAAPASAGGGSSPERAAAPTRASAGSGAAPRRAVPDAREGAPSVRDPAASPAGPRSVPTGDLAALRAHALDCRDCSLCEGRSHVVFGEGALAAPDWMIVGEAPGDHDDRTGQPFQGDAGALLSGMLSAMGVAADGAVYYTNLVKCRPLGNRPPSAEEIAACLPYLRRQIALLAPRRILALGRIAAQTLTGSEAGLDQLRGRVHAFQADDGRSIPLMVTYHPASLLLQPQHKPDAWRDLILARRQAG